MDQIILINKERGISSHDVVYKLRKILKIKKIGHCGTLDPLAEGLLVMVIGKCTKAAQFIESEEKEYITTITFGKNSVTLDEEGPFDNEKEIIEVSEKDIKEVFACFKGIIKQTPPIYSALKVDGKRLYQYARNNEKVEIKEREIQIKSLELIDYDIKSLTFKCVCSKGTYIRTLANDICLKLNNLGYVSYLKRTRIGKNKIENAFKLQEIENGNYKSLNMYEALSSYKMIEVNEEVKKDVMNGKKMDFGIDGEFIVIDKEKNVIAFFKDNKLIRGLF